MSKFVAGVFKIIIVSTLIIIVGMLVSYVTIMYSLNKKIEAVMYSMSNDVARNNYLTEEAKETYLSMLEDIIKDYCGDDTSITKTDNGVVANSGLGGPILENLVTAISINYTGVADELKEVKPYGSSHKVRIKVYVRHLRFLSSAAQSSNTYNISDFEGGKVNSTRPIEYENSVPCYRYIK